MLDFMGIGAQKAGTSWLHEMLSLHPQIAFPAGKEIHFWNRRYEKGIAWYQSLFTGHADKRKGEITPAYAILEGDRVQEIYRLNPKLRIIYLIRNPIERAWSAALMSLARIEMQWYEASDQWFIDNFLSAGSRQRGDYEACIRTWRSIFPAEQLLILRYEEIAREPRALLDRCCMHLGVSAEPLQTVDDDVLKKRVFAGSGHPIRPSLLPLLRALYYPKITSLGAYLDEDFSDWRI